MIEELELVLSEVRALHSRLVLLVADSESERSLLLRELAQRRETTILYVGSELGTRLVPLPINRRPLAAPSILRELADSHAGDGLVVLDNIELLFDRTLKLNPVGILRQLARVRSIVAAWPGQVAGEKLIYSEPGHAERQQCVTDGLVLFNIL